MVRQQEVNKHITCYNDRWTTEDEERIVGLVVQGDNINISNTRYGRKVGTKKREFKVAVDCMTRRTGTSGDRS